LSFKLENEQIAVENSFKIVEKKFLKVKGGLMRFGFKNGIGKDDARILMKWEENEQGQIVFQQLTNLNLNFDNQNVRKLNIIKLNL